MKMFTVQLVILIMILIICSCGSSSDSDNKSIAEQRIQSKSHRITETPTSVKILLCDYSRSIDSSAIDNLKKTAKEIILTIAPRTKLIVLPINGNRYAKPIYDFVIPKKGTKASQRKIWFRNIQGLANVVSDSLQNLYDNEDPRRTCILVGLKAVWNILNDEELKNAKIELFVITDMLECCYEKKRACGEDVENYDKLMKAFEAEEMTKYPLANHVNFENFEFVHTSSRNQEYFDIYNSKEFEEYWLAVSKSLGYEKQIRIKQLKE